jgi:hypothetical protein
MSGLTSTLTSTYSVVGLRFRIGTQVRSGSQHPNITASGIEEQSLLLGGSAHADLRNVVSASVVILQSLGDGCSGEMSSSDLWLGFRVLGNWECEGRKSTRAQPGHHHEDWKCLHLVVFAAGQEGSLVVLVWQDDAVLGSELCCRDGEADDHAMKVSSKQ